MSTLVDALPSTTVRTVEIDVGDALELTRLPRAGAVTWLRGGEGMVGWGELARFTVSGPDRFERARRWWAALSERLTTEDSVVLPGTGPLAFGSFSFDSAAESVLIVPRVVIGVRAGRAWLTTTHSADVPADDQAGTPEPIVAPGPVSWSDGAVSGERHLETVAAAIRRIRAGELEKVVLARDVVATAADDLDPRHLLRRLLRRYPECWTFAVDGLLGATPELLVRRDGDQVFSRVLAGTAWPANGTGTEDSGTTESTVDEIAELAATLRNSAKNMTEHRYAAESAAEALAPYCRNGVSAPPEPSVLRLPNVIHLATDVVGRLRRPTSVLELVDALHPTAAICGTPTAAAADLIGEIEPTVRGRYSGPVGWVDSAGDGEFGIALRCAQLSGRTARLFAGGGIVADSDPATELAETEAKFAVIRDALAP